MDGQGGRRFLSEIIRDVRSGLARTFVVSASPVRRQDSCFSTDGSVDAARQPGRDFHRQAEDIGLWQLRDQEPLDRWVNGRCILVGDGAHAMLPHQGQGASQAFEDAEALGYVLRSLTTSSSPSSSPPSFEEVNAALQRVFSIRYKRATYIQQLSRAGGLGEMRRKGLSLANGEEAPPLNPMKQQEYTWGYWGAERWEAERKDWLA
jgi:salicylate hydroxylase